MSITYGITVHNEGKDYLTKLFTSINSHINDGDEILILDDFSSDIPTQQCIETQLNDFGKFTRLIQHKFNNNFAEHKNIINANAHGDYIFQLDADEYPHEVLLLNIKNIITYNPDTELYLVPRINIIPDVDDVLIKTYGWNINKNGWINFPDHQGRIYKNDYPRIRWERPVHEVITGYKVRTTLPNEPSLCMYHIKTKDRQIKQNTFYTDKFK